MTLKLLMSQGGDERITLDVNSGRNRYGSAPWPSQDICYASSTANNLSAGALAYISKLKPIRGDAAAYRARLEEMRARIRAAYGLPAGVDILFSPSGTDLEFAALAIASGRFGRPVHNILLGGSEVGSGCELAAQGRYFNETTARGSCRRGEPVAGLCECGRMVQVSLRKECGALRPEQAIVEEILERAELALAGGANPLIHVLHGSKLGARVPSLGGVDRLLARFGGQAGFVVDACQARLGGDAIRAYLARGAMVMLTGSKFLGGPPFSGILLVPQGAARPEAALPSGLVTLFRRAEWPLDWPGAGSLPDEANDGLALRLAAALFELERFLATDPATVAAIIAAFRRVTARFTGDVGARIIRGHGDHDGDILAQTLCVIDMAGVAGVDSYDRCTMFHRDLMDSGVRLGQPVKHPGCVIRLALSMPQIVELCELGAREAEARLDLDFEIIAALIAKEPPAREHPAKEQPACRQ